MKLKKVVSRRQEGGGHRMCFLGNDASGTQSNVDEKWALLHTRAECGYLSMIDIPPGLNAAG